MLFKPGLQKFIREKPDFRLLLVRNDGLGDLITTLPLVAAIKEQAPQCTITMLVRKPFLDFTKAVHGVDDTILDEGILLKRDLAKFSSTERKVKQLELIENIRKREFDIALLPYAESESARLIHEAEVPFRIGSIRRSFFYHFTNYFTLSRKKSQYSEYELNLQYLNILGMKNRYTPVQMDIPSELNTTASSRKKIVLHPYKRNDTSLAWPMQRYVELSETLIQKGFDVVVMGDFADGPEILKYFKEKKGLTIDVNRDLIELGQLLLACDLYIGNSSGPLHYAALMGRPHIGIYPVANSVSNIRWKTLPVSGRSEKQRQYYLLKPDINCGQRICRPGPCGYENCLAEIRVDSVLQAVNYWLD